VSSIVEEGFAYLISDDIVADKSIARREERKTAFVELSARS
jgi:hypothetical protein